MKKIKYPADRTVHWPTGPVNTCENHGNALVTLSRMLGSHVGVTKLLEPAECSNCLSEQKNSLPLLKDKENNV